MIEPITKLGEPLGIRLTSWQQEPLGMGALIRGDHAESPSEQNGFCYLGSLEFGDLPPEPLHEMVVARNRELVELFKEYAAILSKFDYAENAEMLHQFKARCRFPPLEKSIQDIPEFKKPYVETMNIRYGVDSIGSNNHPTVGRFSIDSLAGASLIPEIEVYLDYFANNAPQKLVRNQRENQEFTRDFLGWKNYIKTLDPYLTRFFFKSVTAFMPFSSFDRHAYILGGSGSGKSELIKLVTHHIIASKAAKNYSAVIIDPHGDLAQEVARFKECYDNDRIIFFDPEGSKYETPSLNIFAIPDQEEKTIDIVSGNIADAFDEIIADTSISSQMRVLLIPCISVLLRRKGSSLSDLQRFMVDEENEDLIALGLKSPNVAHAQFFQNKFTAKTYATTKASIYTRLQNLLNSTQFRRMINPNATLDLDKELNKGKIVIFSLAKSSIGNDVSGALGRFIVSQIKNIGFRRQTIPMAKRVPTYVFIDECQNYIGESIERTLVELRKYKIHMILANQILGQNMSSQLTKIILGNTGVKFSGYNGEASHTAMGKELGVDTSELRKLTTGKFYCKINDPKKDTVAFALKVPSFLVGNKNGMTSEDWYRQKKKGWRGYVNNEILDGKKAKTQKAKSATEAGIATTPDYVDKDSDGKRKPKFDF